MPTHHSTGHARKAMVDGARENFQSIGRDEDVFTTAKLSAGHALFSLRLAIVQPPFAHICRIMGLDRYTLPSKT